MPTAPWVRPTGVDVVLEQWSRTGVRACLTADATLPAEAGRFVDLPAALDDRLRAGLRAGGVDRLYAHQLAAVEAALGGRHVVVATPTASGKSLCFHLPVLQALARAPGEAAALYLYPTKALARDQEASVRELAGACGIEAGAVVYDGDTPGDARRAARAKSAVVMTNPDMLHAGILPHHAHWARLFERLRYVVLDELHTYRGRQGADVARLVRRVRERLSLEKLQRIGTSATMASSRCSGVSRRRTRYGSTGRREVMRRGRPA